MMKTPKRIFNQYFRETHQMTGVRSRFGREIRQMFDDFREWYKVSFVSDKPPQGVTYRLFRKWCLGAGIREIRKIKRK